MVDHHKQTSVQWKYWFAVLTAKVKRFSNVSLDDMNRCTFCNQTQYGDTLPCEKWVAIFNVKVTVTEFRFIQWNHDYFYYMFWTADFFGDQLSLTVHVRKLECVKRSHAVFKVTVKVLNFNDCLPGQYLWLIKLNMVMHIISQSITQKYHFATFKVKATIVSTRSSEILKLLQPKLV